MKGRVYVNPLAKNAETPQIWDQTPVDIKNERSIIFCIGCIAMSSRRPSEARLRPARASLNVVAAIR